MENICLAGFEEYILFRNLRLHVVRIAVRLKHNCFGQPCFPNMFAISTDRKVTSHNLLLASVRTQHYCTGGETGTALSLA